MATHYKVTLTSEGRKSLSGIVSKGKHSAAADALNEFIVLCSLLLPASEVLLCGCVDTSEFTDEDPGV